jgi:Zn-finger nucleic acid-binding protein
MIKKHLTMQNIRIQCSCGHQFNSRMKNCPFCGAERVLNHDGQEYLCPVCECRLQEHVYKTETVSICGKCNGLWLSNDELQILTSERSVFSDDSLPRKYVRGPLEKRGNYVKCPVCRKPMVRSNFGRISGVIIDICGDHGAWFDAGELEKVRTFVANGGLQVSQDREIEKNKSDIDLLKYKVKDLELMEKILHKWKLKRYRYRKL